MKQSKNKKRSKKRSIKNKKKYYGGQGILHQQLLDLASDCNSNPQNIVDFYEMLLTHYVYDINRTLEDINSTTSKGYNALRVAYENDCFENFITLLNLGAKDVYDIRRHTVLLKSIADRRINYINALLDHPHSITVNDQTLRSANYFFPNENIYAEPLTEGAKIIKSIYSILISQGDITLPTASSTHVVEGEPYNTAIRTRFEFLPEDEPEGETPEERDERHANAVGVYRDHESGITVEEPIAVNEADYNSHRPQDILLHLYGTPVDAIPITHIEDANVSSSPIQKAKRFGGRKSRKIRKSKI